MTKAKRGIKGFFLLLLGVVLGLAGGIYLMLYMSAGQEEEPAEIKIIDETIAEEEYTITIENVREAILPAGELISTKYYYTDADVYENYKEAFGVKIPFTTDEVVFTYDGVISVGVDILSVSFEIDNEARRITFTLPELRIISNEIDASSFEYPYIFDSVFNSTNMSDYTILVDELKEQKAGEVLNNKEFMAQALENTKTVLTQFLTAAETTREYTVEFK